MDRNDTFYYGYLPSETAAWVGVGYFSLAATTCALQTIFGPFKHYWMVLVILASIGEAIGWGGRLWAHYQPADWMPFTIQLCSLIITPVFLSAATYVFFCRIIEKLEFKLFHLSNRWYWVWFVICDIASLAIQTVGGVQVGNAQDLDTVNRGLNVMHAGIIFQFSNTFCFTVLILAAWLRLRKTKRTMLIIAGWPAMTALCSSTLMLLIRNGYRIAELSEGWQGHVIRTEWYLIDLDMIPMALGILVFILFSPPLLFDRKHIEW